MQVSQARLPYPDYGDRASFASIAKLRPGNQPGTRAMIAPRDAITLMVTGALHLPYVLPI